MRPNMSLSCHLPPWVVRAACRPVRRRRRRKWGRCFVAGAAESDIVGRRRRGCGLVGRRCICRCSKRIGIGRWITIISKTRCLKYIIVTELVVGFYLEIEFDVEYLSLITETDSIQTLHGIYLWLNALLINQTKVVLIQIWLTLNHNCKCFGPQLNTLNANGWELLRFLHLQPAVFEIHRILETDQLWELILLVPVIDLFYDLPLLAILWNAEHELLWCQFPVDPDVRYPPDLINRENQRNWFRVHVVESFLRKEVQALFGDWKGVVGVAGLDRDQFETGFVQVLGRFQLRF